MKKINLLIFMFCILAHNAIANNSDPIKSNLPINEETSGLKVAGEPLNPLVAFLDAPCRYCGTCKGVIICVYCTCGGGPDCNAAMNDLYNDLCALGCCYSVD